MFTLNKLLFGTGTVFLLLIASAHPVQATPQNETAEAKPTVVTVSTRAAENTLRTFLIAPASQDAKTLRRTTLPLSEADFAYLAEAPPVSEGVLKQARAQLRVMSIRTLRAGQSFQVPQGKTLTVAPSSVNAKRVLLFPAAFPMALPLEEVNGGWRVDAKPLVAALKVAKRVRKERQNKWPLIAGRTAH